MAGLLSWVGNKVKQDIVQPVKRDVVQPVAHAAGNVQHAAGNVQHAATTLGAGAVQFIPQFAENYANTFANLGAKAANHTPVIRPGGVGNGGRQITPQTIQQNMGGNRFLNKTLKFSGATGTNKQLAGDVAQIGLSTLPGAGKGASLLTKTAIGAGTGAGFNAASTFGQGGNLKQIGKSAALGGTIGAALPLAGRGAKLAAPKVGNLAKDVVTMKPQRNVSDSQLAAANRVSMTRNGFPDNTKPGDMHAYRQVQKKLGVHDVNDTKAVDDLIGARMTYQNRTPLQNVLRGHQPLSLDSAGKGLVSEDGSVIPTFKKLASKGDNTAPTRVTTPEINTDGSHSGSNNIVEFPHQSKIDEYRANKAKANANNSGYTSGKSDIVVRDEAGNELSRIPYDKAVKKWGTTDQTELAHKLANGDVPRSAKPAPLPTLSNRPVLSPQDEIAAIHRQANANRGGKLTMTEENRIADLQGHIQVRGGKEPLPELNRGSSSEPTISQPKTAPAPSTKPRTAIPTKPQPKTPILATGAKAGESVALPKTKTGVIDKQLNDAQKAQRQDELTQYPKGTRSQVKVTTKAPTTSDAEFQSLASTAEGSAKKVGNKVIDTTGKKVIRNADAERAVQDVLKKGGSSDEALDAYINATGSDLQTAVRDVKRVASESNLGFNGGKNPLLGTVKLPEVQAGDHNQAFLNADFVKQHETAIGQQALDSFHALSEHDKTLLKNIETDTVSSVAKKADNPEAFTAAEKNIRTYYDTRHAYDNALGIDVGYRANYLRQIFDKAENEAKANMPDQVNLKGGNQNPGYKQHRSFDTLNTEVGNALERDIHGSSTNHAKLAYSEGLQQAYPGKVNASGQLVRDDTGAYHQLTNRYGEGVTASKDIASRINSRTRTETTNSFLQKYDKANAGLKYVKLGGGAFHALTEAGNFIGQQLTSGKLFTEPRASGRVLKTFFSPKTMERSMTEFRANGTLDKASISGLKIMAKDILADANVTLGGKVSKYSGIQALHDATFQREIPYAKLKMFEQKTKGLDVHNPADLARMRSISQGINDLFGGINRDIHGIRPNEFKVLQRFVLATDFTEGKIKTAFNTVNITDRSPAANLARQAVVGKVLLFAGLATGGAALAGDYKGKTPKQIAADILKKAADPNFQVGTYKVGLPSTHVSEFTKPISPLFRTDGKDRFAGIQHYGTNRLAAIPSELLQLRTNKDATGARIYGKDYKANGGNTISGGKVAANIASGLLPIPGAQAVGVTQGKVSPAAAIANVIGLRANNYEALDAASKAATTDTTSPVAKLQATEKEQNKQLKASLSPEDYKLSHLSKTDRKKLIDNGSYTQAKFDGLDNYVKNEKQKLGISVADTKPNLYKSPDAEYKALQDAYNTKVNTKAFADDAQRLTAQKALARAKVGASYDKSIRDLYNFSNADLYNYVSTNPDGNNIAKQVLDYSQALKDAGFTTTAKFKNKYGAVTLGDSTTGVSRSSSGRKGKGVTAAQINKIQSVRLKTKAPSFKVKTAKAPKLKTTHTKLPTYAAKTPKITVKKAIA